ncbi:MAG: helicase C-terminal domain-containing protein [Promethearchaeota archaeon]
MVMVDNSAGNPELGSSIIEKYPFLDLRGIIPSRETLQRHPEVVTITLKLLEIAAGANNIPVSIPEKFLRAIYGLSIACSSVMNASIISTRIASILGRHFEFMLVQEDTNTLRNIAMVLGIIATPAVGNTGSVDVYREQVEPIARRIFEPEEFERLFGVKGGSFTKIGTFELVAILREFIEQSFIQNEPPVTDLAIFKTITLHSIAELEVGLESIRNVARERRPDTFPDIIFPYPAYKPTQDEFISWTHDRISKGGNIIINAPNGFGKTISVLSAVLPVARTMKKKIVYLCRTHAQSDQVMAEISTINAKNPELAFSGTAMRGRVSACSNPRVAVDTRTPSEAARTCSALRKTHKCGPHKKLVGYHPFRDTMPFPARVKEEAEAMNAWVEEFLDLEPCGGGIDWPALLDFCNSKGICPYLFNRALTRKVEVIACNYTWVFSPTIRSFFLQMLGVELEDLILVIDEAHNLPRVLEDHGSLSLSSRHVQGAIDNDLELLGTFLHEMARGDAGHVLDKIASALEIPPEQVLSQVSVMFAHGSTLLDHLSVVLQHEYRQLIQLKDGEKPFDPSVLVSSCARVLGMDAAGFKAFITEFSKISSILLDRALERDPSRPSKRAHVERIVTFFLDLLATHDRRNKCHYAELEGHNTGSRLHSRCLDPYTQSEGVMARCFASASLSGTISPAVYGNLCLRDEENVSIRSFPSPFTRDQLQATILTPVTSKQDRRSEHTYDLYRKAITSMVRETPGNCGVFFPSYGMMSRIADPRLVQRLREMGVLVFHEDAAMSSAENDDMIDDFKQASEQGDGAILFGVCDGRNSEGKDFPGNQMNAVMLCGVPFAVPTYLIKKKIEYYDEIFDGRGWEYAYTVPAFQKSNQACGRPLRRPGDVGYIILADSRFAEKKELVSSWISDVMDETNSIEELGLKMKLFFEKNM